MTHSTVAGRGVPPISRCLGKECEGTRRVFRSPEEKDDFEHRDTPWPAYHRSVNEHRKLVYDAAWYTCIIIPLTCNVYIIWMWIPSLLAVKSFVELVRFLFTIPGVKFFLSGRLC